MDSMPQPTRAPATRAGTSLIRLEGRDALALLHRISTQSLADLAPGEARATLFCDFRGRLLHRAVACVTRDSAVWLLRDDAPAEELLAHLDRHVFREDVRMAGPPRGLVVRAVPRSGRSAGTLLERDGVPMAVPVGRDLSLEIVTNGGDPSPADEEGRIMAGRPRHGHEVDPAFNPFEVGLAQEVHLDKGCYTGQEALLRMVTYGGVRRRLARIAGRGAPPDDRAALISGGQTVGQVTSAVRTDRGWIGLAVLHERGFEPEAALAIEGSGAIEPPFGFPPTRPLGLP